MARSEGRSMGTSRGGARRGAKPKRSVRPHLIALGVTAVVALVAWGVLVWVAIHFGRSARGGDSGKWIYLAAASVGAVVCLFLSLWLVTLLLRRIGVVEDNRQPAHPHRDDSQPVHSHRDDSQPAHSHRDDSQPAHSHRDDRPPTPPHRH